MRPISAEAREARTWTSVDQLSVRHAAQVWGLMVPRGLEPRTLRLLAIRSGQLSYETICKPYAVKTLRPARYKLCEKQNVQTFRQSNHALLSIICALEWHNRVEAPLW